MIAHLRGTVAGVAPDGAVIEIGGVGMRVQCTPGTLATLRPGESAQVATSLVVREDSLTLFGFASDDERNVFELLQTASGVGPRLALAMLAVHSPDALRRAVATGDLDTLTLAELYEACHLRIPIAEAHLPCRDDALGKAAIGALDELRIPLRELLKHRVGDLYANMKEGA